MTETLSGHPATIEFPTSTPPEDLAHAAAVLRASRGHYVGDAALRSVLECRRWKGLYRSVKQTVSPDLRRSWPVEWCDRESGRNPEAPAIRAALAAAEAVVAAEPDDQATDEASGPAPFDLGLIDSRTFFGADLRSEWLARGVLVAGESCVMGGPSKSLKTSILIDLVISLGSGTPFLGRFDVPAPVPVGLISGESGQRVIQANAKQVCIARGIGYDQAGSILWGFKLPQLSNSEHLATLARAIRDHGLKVVALDPLYMSLLAGSSGIEASNMFHMGPLIGDVVSACLDAGATPVFCHHSVKRRESPHEPLGLEDLAFSGIGQNARQWMLISRRKRFSAESGLHELHFHFGGSAGHSGELHLDIETGTIDGDFGGRRWSVTTSSPSEGRAMTHEQAEGEKRRKAEEKARQDEAAREDRVQRDGEKILAAFAMLPKDETPTPSAIRSVTKLSGENFNPALMRLKILGVVEAFKAKVPAGKGARDVDAIRIVAPNRDVQGDLDLEPGHTGTANRDRRRVRVSGRTRTGPGYPL